MYVPYIVNGEIQEPAITISGAEVGDGMSELSA
jgi:hypothetical protein